MVARWAEWAIGVVEAWPDDVLEAPFDPAVQEEAVRLAEQTAAAGTVRDGLGHRCWLARPAVGARMTGCGAWDP